MVFGTPSRLGISLFEDIPAFELVSSCSEQEIQIIIPSVYQQVLGNAYVIKSERATMQESQIETG